MENAVMMLNRMFLPPAAPEYKVTSMTGTPSKPTFTMICTLLDQTFSGTGRSKKEAKLAASQEALEKIFGKNFSDGGAAGETSVNPSNPHPLSEIDSWLELEGVNLSSILKELYPDTIFELISADGPSHAPQFCVRATLASVSYEGRGVSKREAKLQASKALLTSCRAGLDLMTGDMRSSQVQPDVTRAADHSVDPILLDVVKADNTSDSLVRAKSFTGVTKIIGMDCEMVGVGISGTRSIPARVSIVNQFGHKIYDNFVAPRRKVTVTDFRTAVSGVRPEDLQGAPKFRDVRAKVSALMKGKILVGHSIKHDLNVLHIDHPKEMIRDTSEYKPFKTAFGGRTPSLKNLAERFLGVAIQTGEHSSVQDSQAAVRLYTMFRKEWEAAIETKQIKNKNAGRAASKPKPEIRSEKKAVIKNADMSEELQQALEKFNIKKDMLFESE